MTRNLFCIFASCFVFSLLPRAIYAEAINDCQTIEQLEPICLFTNPEDIEALPDNKTLLISQMGNMEGTLSGNLVFFDSNTQTVRKAFPLPQHDNNELLDNWGESTCSAPNQALFSPHGISLKQRHDGRHQLAVVNHGGRDSIEMFEVLQQDQQYHLSWRGCVLPEDGIFMNDVALMKNGGFVATHMFDKHAPHFFGLSLEMWKAMIGFNTGYVLEWQPSQEPSYRILSESHGGFLNGITLSPDEKYVFASVYAEKKVLKLERSTGKLAAKLKLGPVDNFSWSERGSLLATAHTGSQLDQKKCFDSPGKTCSFEFTVYAINPETLAYDTILSHKGAPMGAATVAQQLGQYLYLGTFSGDRLVKTPYREK